MAKNCYDLVEAGFVNFAADNLDFAFSQMTLRGRTVSEADSAEFREFFTEYIRASRRAGVEATLGYAKQFYDRKDNKTARQWLRYSKRENADKIDLDIGPRIAAMKSEYGDKIPLWLW